MIVTIHMKTILLLASAAALFAYVPAVQATPTSSTGKILRLHEIHRGQSVSRHERSVERARAVSEEPLFRSHAECEMVNPG